MTGKVSDNLGWARIIARGFQFALRRCQPQRGAADVEEEHGGVVGGVALNADPAAPAGRGAEGEALWPSSPNNALPAFAGC